MISAWLAALALLTPSQTPASPGSRVEPEAAAADDLLLLEAARKIRPGSARAGELRAGVVIRVQNTSGRRIRKVRADLLYFDPEDVQVASQGLLLGDLGPGETRTFALSARWPVAATSFNLRFAGTLGAGPEGDLTYLVSDRLQAEVLRNRLDLAPPPP